MKMTTLLAFAVAALATSLTASAIEVGVQETHYAKSGVNTVGVYGAQKFAGYGLQASTERALTSGANFNRFALEGTYDVYKLGNFTLTGKAGAARVVAQNVTGNAVVVGLGTQLPLSKNLNATADYSYQKGADSIRALNGSAFSVGLKYSF
jgi:outer membrane autotransporter protein